MGSDKAQAEHNATLQGLQKEPGEQDLATSRLYEAVEKGFLPMDETLLDRSQRHKARREALLIEIAGTRRERAMPLEKVTAGQITQFGAAMRSKLVDRDNGFSKRYLRLLVSEIRITDGEVRMKGSKAALLEAMLEKKVGTAMVPTFSNIWLPDLDSNQGPAD